MGFAALREIVDTAKKEQKQFWEVILEEDCRERNVDAKESFAKMSGIFEAMREADRTYNPALRSVSKMAGGDGTAHFRKNFWLRT